MMKDNESIILSRQCEAIQIPSGKYVTLPAGSRVWVAQSHAGGTTVSTERGDMVRIAGKDADAIGMKTPSSEPVESPAAAEEPGEIESLVWHQLEMCFDPEIPINIVDLGLVYHCQVVPLAGGGNRVEVRFTLTAPGCGMGEVIKEEIRSKVLSVPGIQEVDVELIWDPTWDQSMISGAAKHRLGML